VNTIAIDCRNLSKLYRIGERENYLALRDTITDVLHAPWRKMKRFAAGSIKKPAKEPASLWALRDVSFRVRHGEILGIIGRNGAGKSTLLKILSRITEPTRGFADIRGRVGSLLEVGTGFHQELTGRENIYFNGSILGMKKAEIHRKFDEIVQFAEVERFIDTPVKHYSSGMYMRLAFAVAAHLEPEILLVDEVLAVGDAAFQKKCLNKMQEVGEQGRTVFFVSHNMPAVTRLCPRAILLDSGQILRDGPSHQVVSAYLRSGLGTTAMRTWTDSDRFPGNAVARLHAVRVVDEDGETVANVDIRKPVGIEMDFEVLQPGYVLTPGCRFVNEEGQIVFSSDDQDPQWRRRPRPPGRHLSTAWIPGNFLSEGTMIVSVALRTSLSHTVHFFEPDVVAFYVTDSLDGDSARGDYGGFIPGVVRPLLRWTNRTAETIECPPQNAL
jgi:lipopolysaccharide transport system ATP-binding protein